MKYTVTAVIPTVQYGNIQPSIEVEADSFEEAQSLVMPHIEQLWSTYADKPLPKRAGNSITVQCFVGGSINYDDSTHTYTNDKGEVYLSGSQYAKSLEKLFNLEGISKVMATKWGVDAKDIKAMWKLKNDVSKGFGTAMHKALELYGKYNGLATQIEKTTHLHDHPVIKKAVESLYAGRESEKAEYEVFIVDHQAKRAGQIDRLLIIKDTELGGKICRIQDYKTNADISDKLDNYWEQLKFYAGILEANGWTVEGCDIFHWNGEWKEYHK